MLGRTFLCLGLLASLSEIQEVASVYCKYDMWTRWYDRDNPSATGDWETLSDLRRENPGRICRYPTAIEAQLTNGRPYTVAREVVTVSRLTGLICKNSLQPDKSCADYRVRFCCPSSVPCYGYWTGWYDRDDPGASGDWEKLSDLRKEHPGQICQYPTNIEAQLTDGRSYTVAREVVTVSKSVGLYCKNALQPDKRCADYKVRFCCASDVKCSGYWTPWYDRDDPSASGDWEKLSDLRKENPGKICQYPKAVEARLVDGRPYKAAGEVVTVSRSVGFYCKNALQRDRHCADYKVRFCCPF